MTIRSVRFAAQATVAALLVGACQSGGGGTGAGRVESSALAAGYPFQSSEECDRTVAERLQELGLAPAQVDNIWYQEQQTVEIDHDSRLVGYLAYARLVDQPGLLVVDMNAFCIVNQVYTRDGLSLPGVSAF